MLVRILALGGAAACLILGLFFPWMKIPIIVGLCYGLAALGRHGSDARRASFVRTRDVRLYRRLYGGFPGPCFPGVDGLLLDRRRRPGKRRRGGAVGLFVVRYREIFFGMLNLALSMVLYSVLGQVLRHHRRYGRPCGSSERPSSAWHFDRAGYETALLVFAVFIASLGLGWVVQRFFGSSAGEAWPESRPTRLGSNTSACLPAGFLEWIHDLRCAGGSVRCAVRAAAGLGNTRARLLGSLGRVRLHRDPWWSDTRPRAFLGAAVFQVIQLIGAAFFAGIWKLLLGVTLIVVILAAPSGITGLLPLARRSKSKDRRRASTCSGEGLMELVRTEKLALNFGGVVVADNIDFSLHEGERLAVIGANGAGKTTFIKCNRLSAPEKW